MPASGNSVEISNLLRLHELTSKDTYRERAKHALTAFGGALASAPTSLSEMLLAVDLFVDVPKEIVLVIPKTGTRQDAGPLLAKVARTFVPNRVLTIAVEGEPLAAEKTAREGKATAYVCEHGACELPTNDSEVFAAQLRQRSRP